MNLTQLFLQSLNASIKITLIILVMMIIVELLVLKLKGKIEGLANKRKTAGYLVSSFFGIIPGCIGTFAMDSLYMSGLLSFGGIIAVMVATSGDEAFVMLGLAAKGEISWFIIIALTLVLFLLGLLGAFIADLIKQKAKIKFCTKCRIVSHPNREFTLNHFLKEHIVNHILKKHIWQIFLWLWAAIFVINLWQEQIHLDFSSTSMFYVLLIASLVGILPISGPNVFLIVMFAKGLIPFSVLLANSIIQDGHGLLPITGFSLSDAFKIKLFNFIFGLSLGVLLLLVGL